MPQGLIVTEAGLMYQCLSPRRISKRGCRPQCRGLTSPTTTSASPAIPEYSEAVEISRYGSQDVHTHYRSVINVMGILRQVTDSHRITAQRTILSGPLAPPDTPFEPSHVVQFSRS